MISVPDDSFYILAFSGGALLLLPVIVLLVFSIDVALDTYLYAVVILFLSSMLGVALSAKLEWMVITSADAPLFLDYRDLRNATAAVIVGTIITLGLTVELGVPTVVSASIVGIIAAIFFSSVAVPAYCGAFVGMTAPELIPTYWHALFAGGLASIVYAVSQPVFQGVGGKLGTIAFVGTTLTVVLSDGTFQSGHVPTSTIVILIVIYSIIGAVVTFAIHDYTVADAVFASGIVGLAGGVLLPILYPSTGEMMAASVFAASFAGMSDSARLPALYWLIPVGAIAGLFFVYSLPYIGGSGGKLGTIAFGSVLAVHGFLAVTGKIDINQLTQFPEQNIT